MNSEPREAVNAEPPATPEMRNVAGDATPDGPDWSTEPGFDPRGALAKPERIVIADTSRENPTTWTYLNAHVAPLLAVHGLRVEIAPHSLSTVDLYGKNGDLLIPAFTRTGKLPAFCSTEWKRRVVARYLRAEGYGPARPINLWIGISTDEVERARVSETGWLAHRYPLLFDVPMRRHDCERLIESAGLPIAPKSSCEGCPFQSNAQWRALRDDQPEAWARAVALDEQIRERDPDVFLHRSARPLSEADLDDATNAKETECQTGMCFV